MPQSSIVHSMNQVWVKMANQQSKSTVQNLSQIQQLIVLEEDQDMAHNLEVFLQVKGSQDTQSATNQI